MAKLIILAAALLALIALSHTASATRTTVTTTVFDDEAENPRGESCRQQMQRQQELRHCQMYLSQRRPYELAMTTTEQNPQQEHLDECCRQLRNIDEDCRCEAINMMMRQRGEELRQARQDAEDLPNSCNLSPRHCKIQDSWF